MSLSVSRAACAESMALLNMDGPAVVGSFDGLNNMIRALSVARGLPLADIAAAMPDAASLWGDATHFRLGGATVAADVVAKAVLLSEAERAEASGDQPSP